jgi:acetyl esterase/lipase
MHALMLGTTLMAERIVDVDRAVDYLESRGDADMSRVGCMGNSGGGTISLFAAAMLDRIRFVMPSSYFCSFADSILALFHCVCNYVPHLQRHAEMADVAGLIAPRPLVIVNGVQDGIFPIEAARREYARLAGIYRAAGAADRCHFVECSGGHRFYADEAWPVMLRELERGSA